MRPIDVDEAFPEADGARFVPLFLWLTVELWTGAETIEGLALEVREARKDGYSIAQGVA